MATKTKPKLLVVDDEPENLDLMYRTFRREFQIFRANSPASALEILETEGEMAVIVSDQSMPQMTGIEFLSKTVTPYPKTIRILLTGYVPDELSDERKAVIFKFISKPWNPEELKAVIKEAATVYAAS